MFIFFVFSFVLALTVHWVALAWFYATWIAMLGMSIGLLLRVFWPNQTPLERERAIFGGQLSVMPRWLRLWALDEKDDRWSGWFR
jgi:hypothetical protein